MKTLEKFLTGFVIGGLMAIMIYAFTSCTPKYGCGNGHKKQSWDRMVRRINSPK
jgi:hypothetical protein